MPVPAPYSVTLEGPICVARFSIPTLADPNMLHELKLSLTTLVQSEGFRGLLLNMEGVTFIVSAFLNVILAVNRDMRTDYKPIRVCSTGPSVRETLMLTRLHTRLPIHVDQANALEAIAVQSRAS
jgi:anti-anti-sigma factor